MPFRAAWYQDIRSISVASVTRRLPDPECPGPTSYPKFGRRRRDSRSQHADWMCRAMFMDIAARATMDGSRGVRLQLMARRS